MNDQKPPLPMKQLIIFAIFSMVVFFGWNYIQNQIWPRAKQLNPDERRVVTEHVAQIGFLAPGGAGLGDLARYAGNEIARGLPPEVRLNALTQFLEAKKKGEEAKRAQLPRPPEFKPTTIDLGNENFNLQVRLTNKGGGVDRVIVSKFDEANEYGKEVKHDGVSQKLRLVPSAADIPKVERDGLPHELTLPSFLIYHYASPDEPRPENYLGELAWTIETQPDANERGSDHQQASFSAKLPDLGVKITKTYTLDRVSYHVGLSVKIEKLPGATPKPFRYQLSGAHGVPIEGVWYTSVYRNFIAGWVDKKGTAKRFLESNAAIHNDLGSESPPRGEGTYQYAAIANQYFASATCVDDDQDNKNFIERVRGTDEGMHPKDLKDKPQLSDITSRMITESLTVGDAPIEHKYLLYNGPIKVRLLHQLRGEDAVPDDLVDHYENKLNLRTMTDYQSDTWIGSFVYHIGWTDVVIAATNVMHSVLGFFQHNLPDSLAGLAIIALTIMVRGLLTPLSRKQTANMQKMQEKMAVLQPQIKRLEEEYKGRDPQDFQRAKMKLMMENGINPAASLGGCVMLILQMPIFMGLYYCLQENVFFRLKSFLWIPNLAAPDMLIRWGEQIRYISAPESLGSPVYLGPYFNILPIIAVTLMIVQQKMTMPPAADENQAMQQKMMKYMMVVMAVFFYKVASGLVLYFIASSVWGVIERKLIPKKKPSTQPPDSGNGAKRKGRPDKPAPAKKSWLATKWGELLEAAEKK